MRLLDWQRALQDASLGRDDRVNRWLHARASGKASLPGIYREAYVARLREALATNYPGLHVILGDDEFKAMAIRYIGEHPPRDASIRWFGARLSEFLTAREPFRSTPALSDLALFEWALRHTVDAADATPVSFDELAARTPDEWGSLRFAWHPSLSALDLDWNVPAVSGALAAHTTPPPPQELRSTWLVWRQRDLTAAWRSVDDVEACLLRRLGTGTSVAEIGAAPLSAPSNDETTARRIAGVLRNAVAGGYLCWRPEH